MLLHAFKPPLDKHMKTGPGKHFSFSAQSESLQLLLNQQYQLGNESILLSCSFITYYFQAKCLCLLVYDVLASVFVKYLD